MRKLYSIIGALALTLSANAVTLPKAVYTLDFEGATTVADFGGIQHGSGEIIVSNDAYFGTYYQNMAGLTESTNRVNFLEVPTDALSQIQTKGNTAEDYSLTIGFWVNATYANDNNIGNYWGPLLNCYNEAGCAGSTWPQAFEIRYGGQIHGNCNGTWYDNNHDDVMEDIMKWSIPDSIEVEGQKVAKGFPDNWHYFTTVYTNVNTSAMHFQLYIDGELKIDQDETMGGDAPNLWAQMSALDRFCIGGNAFNWNDPDNAYAYDDIAFYAGALTQEQIQLIINIKTGNIGDEERLIIARGQLEDAMNEAYDFNSIFAEKGFISLSNVFGDYLMEIDPDSYETVAEINEEINNIQTTQAAYKELMAMYDETMATIEFYQNYSDKTSFPGVNDFNTAIQDAISTITTAQTTEGFTVEQTQNAMTTAIAELESAKITYIFTQEGDVIDVTRAIVRPWFVKEPYEPTVTEESIVYEDEAAAIANLDRGTWVLSATDNIKGATDLNLYFTQGRTTANLFHSSTAAGGILDLQQIITGLPVGFYELSADMASSSAPTNNHVYAISDNITKVSPNATSLAWDGPLNWATLTTDKVYVAEDGIMTIGATSTTTGAQYAGWFCATNFQLKYYGKEYDMSEDVANKKEELTEEIATLKWTGDKTSATTMLNEILNNSTYTDYQKVSQLTDLKTTVNSIMSQEESFTIDAQIAELASKETDETAKAVYQVGSDYIAVVVKSDTMSINAISVLTSLYESYVKLGTDTKSANNWGTSGAQAAAASVATNLKGNEGDREFIAAQSEVLILAMKSSITEFEASEESPKEITALVGNASFDQDQYSAWEIEGKFAVQQAEIEFYNNTFRLSQTITDMPKGVYRLEASGFYRDGSDYAQVVNNQWTKISEESDSTVYQTHANMKLFVELEETSVESSFVSIASDSLAIGTEEDDTYFDYYGNENHVSTDFHSNDKTADPAFYYPYWMWNAYYMVTTLDLYKDNKVAFAISEENSDITIGAYKSTTIASDWAIADKFRLFYLGQEIPTAIEDVKDAETSASSKVAVAYYTLSGTQVQKPQRGVYVVKYSDGSSAKQIFK